MMFARPVSLLVLASLTLLFGCGSEDSESQTQLPDWLTEDNSDLSDSADANSEEAPLLTAPALDKTSLDLQLAPGERFPLRKVVEQELKQASLDGRPQISRSRLELMLAMTVEDVQAGKTLMRVKYDRVKYSHEVAGELVEYDSGNPRSRSPVQSSRITAWSTTDSLSGSVRTIKLRKLSGFVSSSTAALVTFRLINGSRR